MRLRRQYLRAAFLIAHIPVLVCCSAVAGVALAEKMSVEDALKVVIGTGPAEVSPEFYL